MSGKGIKGIAKVILMFIWHVPRNVLVFLIDLYKLFLSPVMGNQCRFYPSCSTYGREAMMVHGAIKGTILTIWRVIRCNPISAGGFDPVPPAETRAKGK